MSKVEFELSLFNGHVKKVNLENEEDWGHIDTVDFTNEKNKFYTGRCRLVSDDGAATEIKKVTDENGEEVKLNDFCKFVNKQAWAFLPPFSRA